MIVIIGNSVAGVAAIETIRQHDKKADITLVGREPYHVYSRPMIPGFLSGKWEKERMFFT